ncbi:MAG TPA: M56 family metallopeptidase [Bryobacteraceae bacterium]|nr:M56 family metallopeptidase [Bryobacteraceae bacterium]
MTAIAHAISAALLHFVWQGLAVSLLLWLALAAQRNSSARLRYATSCAALAIMAALPFVTAWIIYAPAGGPARSGQVFGVPDSAGLPPPAAPALPQWLAALEAWALPVWAAGVLICALRLILSARYASSLRRAGEPAGTSLIDTASRLARHMKVMRPVRVLMSAVVDSPAVIGFLRPAILVPAASLVSLSAGQLEAVLAHELAHIRRHDYLVNLLQSIAETLFFYQPAVWWVSARIRDERELCCDDLAVEICGDPLGYARALTQLERFRATAPRLAVASAGGKLMYRIQRLAGVRDEPRASRAPAVLAIGVAILCCLLNLNWARAQQPAAANPVISRDAIWVDTVKDGDLLVAVRGPGRLTSAGSAELNVPEPQSHSVQVGQSASVQVRNGPTVAGKVTELGSQVVNGTVAATITLDKPLDASAGQEVDGVIRVKTLREVTYVGRPAGPPEDGVFKIDPDGAHATRVKVRLGAGSVNSVQVLEGLKPGDRVILSDMSRYKGIDRVTIQ